MDTATGVQHMNKKSSYKLQRKFAEVGDSNNAPKKKKTKRTMEDGSRTAMVERRWHLPPPATCKMALLRQIGIGRARLRTRDLTHFRNKSLLGAIEKRDNLR